MEKFKKFAVFFREILWQTVKSLLCVIQFYLLMPLAVSSMQDPMVTGDRFVCVAAACFFALFLCGISVQNRWKKR